MTGESEKKERIKKEEREKKEQRQRNKRRKNNRRQQKEREEMKIKKAKTPDHKRKKGRDKDRYKGRLLMKTVI